jgi:hypothetical protein
MKRVVGFFGSIMAAGILFAWMVIPSGPVVEAVEAPGPDWVAIKTSCQMALEKKLKAPRSARFGWGERTTFTDKDPRRAGLGFVGTVDATNSFGGTVRDGFRCWVGTDKVARVEFER